MISSTGKNVYYIELATNSIQYASQLNIYQVPTLATATAAGLTIPVGAPFTLPEIALAPIILFNDAFGLLIGMIGGVYPAVQTEDTQTVSTISPQISVINSIVLTCNLVSNPTVSIPHNLFFATGLSAAYGNQIRVDPYPSYSKIRDGTYQFIELSILDQNLNTLQLFDSEGNITLHISDIEK
jgi:hypothetical protein